MEGEGGRKFGEQPSARGENLERRASAQPKIWCHTQKKRPRKFILHGTCTRRVGCWKDFTSAAQDGRPSDDACRAILLGLRPDGERTLREPFALLRGLAVHEIVRHRHAVWLSASRDGPDMTYDHVRAAARIYARVRAALADAIAQERKRCLLLQRQMRAAGLPASSCFGPHSPMAGWRATWEDTGVCTVHGDAVSQRLLPDQPLVSLAVAPLARARRCPRDGWAPPAALPHDVVQLFVASSADGDAFGATIVSGGDADAP